MEPSNDLTTPSDLAVAGRVVSSGRPPRRAEVRVSGGRVSAVVAPGAAGLAARRLDAGEAYVLPGVVDAHVHCLSSPGEGIEAATRAAAAGGVTTIVEMPYDAGRPVRSVRRLQEKASQVAAEALVDVALLATVCPEGGAADVAGLVEAGACGFKLSLFDTDRQRFPRIPDAELLDVLAAIASAGSLACLHAENDEVVKPLIDRARRQGRGQPIEHCRSRPPVSETEAVLKAAEFAFATGAAIHLCHLSLARSVDITAWYRGQGLDVTCETCPHYLCFSEEDMARAGAKLKINPPLRPAGEREGLWRALAAGRIDMIASDHAPWPLADKTRPDVFDNHSGVPGVETLAPVMLSEGLARGLPIELLAAVLATGPARRFGLSGKGDIAPGYDADLLVFDPVLPGRVDEALLHSRAGWSPYHGRRLAGRVTTVFSRGELIWDGKLHGRPGRGQLLVPGGQAKATGT
jgi:allantoinase